MKQILEMTSFKLKKGISEANFLLAHEKFNRDFISKQEGCVSHMLIRDGDNWSEIVVWDSIELKEKAFEDIYKYDGLEEYMSFIDQDGTDDDIPLYTVVKTY
ncbi:quinol monooxygenase YgiN [Enterococcus sp. PF1-24]|uniref:hypothetical protein n=1 Tax=unclassified Enterococcus TaxID=2608891 RepID=UPI002476ED3C|nr:MULTISPECIES: hypothetical protein [unclassified Enterococcus]MDH6364983.1 quinol monooxygenase YgiN [Enterococcus sp. PFB1-1]MDH6402084.1 quinol monooxygenase YgiN [Enterococcus sp. PF1-24]